MTQKRKRKTRTNLPPRPEQPEDFAGWTDGEIKWEKIAAAEGIAPLGTLAQIARGTPKDATELLKAIRLLRDPAPRRASSRRAK